MTLREQYNKLENDIYAEFQRLIDVGSYNLVEGIVKGFYEDNEVNETLSRVDKEGIVDVALDIGLFDGIDYIYYTTNSGQERVAYLLGADKESGLHVFDEENWREDFISFSDLNGLYSKIEVIELLQNA